MIFIKGIPALEHPNGEIEQFRRLAEFPKFAVSTLGRVMRVKSSGSKGNAGMILKARPNTTNGYLQVLLTNVAGSKQQIAVHRLVAIAFIPNPDLKPQVNHLDGNKTNNRVGNLEWATPSENSVHGLLLGLKKLPPSRKGTGKLSPEDVRYIRQHYKIGKAGKAGNAAQLAERFGISKSFVCSVAAGRSYKRVKDATEIPVSTEENDK
jgi:hypothetical protein